MRGGSGEGGGFWVLGLGGFGGVVGWFVLLGKGGVGCPMFFLQVGHAGFVFFSRFSACKYLQVCFVYYPFWLESRGFPF